jgi:hypothetical protein
LLMSMHTAPTIAIMSPMMHTTTTFIVHVLFHLTFRLTIESKAFKLSSL